jgi:hypothetical protein
LFVPTGWESFATAAGLLALDRADAAFRRTKKTSKKQKGGTDVDGHESIEHMDSMLYEIQSKDKMSDPDQMSGGGPKKKAKKSSKKTAEKKTGKKTTTKKPFKKTSSKK